MPVYGKFWRLVSLFAAVAVLGATAACGGTDEAGDGGGGQGGPAAVEQSEGHGGAIDFGAPPGLAEPRPGGESQPPPSQLDRKVVRVATVNLETAEVAQRFEDVGNIAAGAGGYVASSSFGHSGDQQTASITVRVPADRYQDVLRQLRMLGDVRDESSNANDVTEEFTDLTSRMRNLQATERQYLEFLARAQDIPSVLQVQDRLSAVRADIEQAQGRTNLLDNSTDLATITVHLNPPTVARGEAADEGRPSVREVAEDAFAASIDVLNGGLIAVVAVAAFAWWVTPVTVAGLFVLRRREQRRTPEGKGRADP